MAYKNIKLSSLSPKMRERLFFADFLEGNFLIEGRKGSGKSLFAVTLAYKLKELFGRPAIMDFHPRPAFGKYKFLDQAMFIDEIEKISTVAKKTKVKEVNEAVEFSLSKLGVDLSESTMILDEAYRYFDCRTPSDKLVRIYGYFIAQSRHYKNSIFILVPSRRMVDWRVRQQIDIVVKVAFDQRTQVVTGCCFNYTTGENKVLKIYGPNYYGLYDSWGAVATRAKILKSLKME